MIWNDTSDKFLGFFDIMGFKDFSNRNDHQEVLRKMLQIEDGIIQRIKLANHGKEAAGTVRPTIFSDSILLVTNGTTAGDAVQIIAASTFLLCKCFEMGIPIKGALSYGMFTANFDKSIFLGQPLIDAYLLQDEMYQYGCILDNKIEKYIEEKYPSNISGLIRFKTPLKCGMISHYNLNWMDAYSRVLKLKDSPRDAIAKLYHSVSGKPRLYVDNTMDFIEKNILEVAQTNKS